MGYTINGREIHKEQPGAFIHDSEDVLLVLLGPVGDSTNLHPHDGFIISMNPCFDVGCVHSKAVLPGSSRVLNASEHSPAPALFPRAGVIVPMFAPGRGAGLQTRIYSADLGANITITQAHTDELSGSIPAIKMAGIS